MIYHKNCNELKAKLSKYKNYKKFINTIYKFFICFTLLIIILVYTFDIYPNFIDNNGDPFHGRIFLCTSYNNEAEIAYIHIWRLYDYVDKFIILTSNITHSLTNKNFTLKPFEQNIRPYMNKVDFVFFNNICNRNDYPTDNLIWCIEKSQRDYAKKYIEDNYNPTENDLFIVVDIDEILTREGIEYIKKYPPNDFKFIKGTLYFPYYYHKVEDWDFGCVIRYNKNIKTLSKYRYIKKNKHNIIKYKFNKKRPLITHCSYCFQSFQEYKNKLKSFAHQEYNKPPYTTNNWIFKSHYCREKIASPPGGYDEPYEGWKHLIPDDERLKYLIDPSFMYPLNQTTYTEKDLETMCDRKFKRTPFEVTGKYKF